MSLLILLCNNHESTINRQILDIDGYDTVRDYKEKLKKTYTRAKLYKKNTQPQSKSSCATNNCTSIWC